jgi:hypothetical protein
MNAPRRFAVLMRMRVRGAMLGYVRARRRTLRDPEPDDTDLTLPSDSVDIPCGEY